MKTQIMFVDRKLVFRFHSENIPEDTALQALADQIESPAFVTVDNRIAVCAEIDNLVAQMKPVELPQEQAVAPFGFTAEEEAKLDKSDSTDIDPDEEQARAAVAAASAPPTQPGNGSGGQVTPPPPGSQESGTEATTTPAEPVP